MGKRLEWEWRLPDGTAVRAQLEMPARVESVWVGGRLASRSAEGGTADGHVLPLSPSGGAYRGATQARVVFDAFGARLASCVLTVDGQVVAPVRAPGQVRAFALPAAGGSAVLILGIMVARALPSMVIAADRRPPAPVLPSAVAPPETVATVAIPPPPAARPDADRVIAGLRPRFRACYQRGLNEDPSMSGRVVIFARVSAGGSVDSATVEERTGTLSPEVEQCLSSVVGRALFAPAEQATSLRVPISFVQQSGSPR